AARGDLRRASTAGLAVVRRSRFDGAVGSRGRPVPAGALFGEPLGGAAAAGSAVREQLRALSSPPGPCPRPLPHPQPASHGPAALHFCAQHRCRAATPEHSAQLPPHSTAHGPARSAARPPCTSALSTGVEPPHRSTAHNCHRAAPHTAPPARRAACPPCSPPRTAPGPAPDLPVRGLPGVQLSPSERLTAAGSPPPRSLVDLGDAAGAHGAATLTDGEAEALLHGDRLDQLDRHLGVVAGHDHLGALGQRDDAGDVGGPEVELRTVVRVERVVAAALVLGQDVDLSLEVGVRGDRAGLGHDLAALDVLTLGATQEQTAVLAGPRLVHLLVEHLDAGDDRLLSLTDAEDLDLRVDRELAAVDL